MTRLPKAYIARGIPFPCMFIHLGTYLAHEDSTIENRWKPSFSFIERCHLIKKKIIIIIYFLYCSFSTASDQLRNKSNEINKIYHIINRQLKTSCYI